VPLVYSNPKLYPRARRSKAIVSHVDFLPTIASLFEVPKAGRAAWEGVDYSEVVLDPKNAKAPQKYTVFTWDDWQAGQAQGPYLPPPNHIVAIREKRWKLAKYYDPGGDAEPQWEMYDLKRDPLERDNLARPGYKRTREQEHEFKRLQRKLHRVRKRRLQPLG
jgi:arylsulfatase A-like enzyme